MMSEETTVSATVRMRNVGTIAPGATVIVPFPAGRPDQWRPEGTSIYDHQGNDRTSQFHVSFRGETAALTSLLSYPLESAGLIVEFSGEAATDGDVLPLRTIVAHRCCGELYAPENELRSIRLARSMGITCVEVDVQVGADGQPVVIHDDTVDRTTTDTGDVDALTIADTRALITDPDAYLSPGWSQGSVPTLDDVLDEFGNQMVLLLDNKDAAAVTASLACLDRHGVRADMAIVRGTNNATLTQIRAAGRYALYGYNPAPVETPPESTIPARIAAGAQAVMAQSGWTAAFVAQCHALGALAGYSLGDNSRRYLLDAFWAMGGDFALAAEPLYLGPAGARGLQRRGNQFVGGRWPHALLPYLETDGGRGIISEAGKWHKTFIDGPRLDLLGFLGRTEGSFQLDFTLGWDTSNAANAGYVVRICCSDDRPDGGSSSIWSPSGYTINILRNQAIDIFRVNSASSRTTIGSVAAGTDLPGTGTGSDGTGDMSAAAGTGTPYDIRIVFDANAGTISVYNMTVDPTTPRCVSSPDFAYPGGYIHAGRGSTMTSTIHGGFTLSAL